MPKAIVYIDGFNLYYGAVKDTPYKWLDLDALCRRLLPKDTVVCIRYFTAKVSGRPSDPGAPVRQETYLRALRTIPHLTQHFGRFVDGSKRKPLVSPRKRGPKTAEVIVTEEKGSDVNLATLLVMDALDHHCDVSVVMSNDSDLVLPIRLLVAERGHPVGVVNPHPPRQASSDLRAASTFFKQLRSSVPPQCQFPRTMSDADGTFTSPWPSPPVPTPP